jgi:hypothetical protein
MVHQIENRSVTADENSFVTDRYAGMEDIPLMSFSRINF